MREKQETPKYPAPLGPAIAKKGDIAYGYAAAVAPVCHSLYRKRAERGRLFIPEQPLWLSFAGKSFLLPGCSDFGVFLYKIPAFMKKRDKILHEAKTRLVAAFGDRIKDVILFGSRAWGKPHRWSDWDFVVVIRGEYDWRFERAICDVMTDIDLNFDVITHPLIVSEHELKHTFRGYEPIFVKALSQGIYA